MQARSAKAAELQATWAQHTFWVGLGGTAGIVLTLAATAWAAWAAQKSASAAERALKSNADALEHARGASRDQLRAYITFVDVFTYLEFDGNTLTRCNICGNWKNTGQTPALSVGFLTRSCPMEDPAISEDLVTFPPIKNDARQGGIIGPGVISETPRIVITRRFLDDMAAQKSRLFVRFVVKYTDLYGTHWEISHGVRLVIQREPGLVKRDSSFKFFQSESLDRWTYLKRV